MKWFPSTGLLKPGARRDPRSVWSWRTQFWKQLLCSNACNFTGLLNPELWKHFSLGVSWWAGRKGGRNARATKDQCLCRDSRRWPPEIRAVFCNYWVISWFGFIFGFWKVPVLGLVHLNLVQFFKEKRVWERISLFYFVNPATDVLFFLTERLLL